MTKTNVVKLLKITFLILLVTIGIIIFNEFNPNYVEYGPYFVLVKNSECTGSTSSECLIYGRSVSIYRTNPKTVIEALEDALNNPPQSGLLLGDYSKIADDWVCSVAKNETINMYGEKTNEHSRYYCWPK